MIQYVDLNWIPIGLNSSDLKHLAVNTSEFVESLMTGYFTTV